MDHAFDHIFSLQCMLIHSGRMQVGIHSIGYALLNPEDKEAEINELSDLYISSIKDAKYEEKILTRCVKSYNI